MNDLRDESRDRLKKASGGQLLTTDKICILEDYKAALEANYGEDDRVPSFRVMPSGAIHKGKGTLSRFEAR